MGFVEILFFRFAFSAAARRVTPSLPQMGEASQREHPLDPSFVKVFHQPSDDYRTIGG